MDESVVKEVDFEKTLDHGEKCFCKLEVYDDNSACLIGDEFGRYIIEFTTDCEEVGFRVARELGYTEKLD